MTSLSVHDANLHFYLLDGVFNFPDFLKRPFHSAKEKNYKNRIYKISIKQQNSKQIPIFMEKNVTFCEIIPNRLILRNNNYAQRKTMINKKFEWLNKYLSAASPKIIGSKFSSINHRTVEKGYRSKNRICEKAEKSRLKTSNELNKECSGILKARDFNYSELRKTSSNQFSQAQGGSMKENLTLCKFFRSKKMKSSFAKPKSSFKGMSNDQENKRIADDFEIKPWNNPEEADQFEFKKQNELPSFFRS